MTSHVDDLGVRLLVGLSTETRSSELASRQQNVEPGTLSQLDHPVDRPMTLAVNARSPLPRSIISTLKNVDHHLDNRPAHSGAILYLPHPTEIDGTAIANTVLGKLRSVLKERI